MDIGRFLQSTSAMGASWARDARKPRVETHEVPLTFSRIVTMLNDAKSREGDVDMDISVEAYNELLNNTAGLRRYTADRFDTDDDALAFYAPTGKVTLRPDPALSVGQHRWRRPTARAIARGNVAGCSYCGAPGQTIGTRCEYCQVAVSR